MDVLARGPNAIRMGNELNRLARHAHSHFHFRTDRHPLHVLREVADRGASLVRTVVPHIVAQQATRDSDARLHMSFPTGPSSRLRSSGRMPNFAAMSTTVSSNFISARPMSS